MWPQNVAGGGSRVPSRGTRVTITSLEPDDLSVAFSLSNTDSSMANALRRVILAEVPTLAIDLVTIEENSSPLQDEFLAHRFGLLPIDSARIREYLEKGECGCPDFCNKCSVQYQLDVFCSDDTQIVTHHDILPASRNAPALLPLPTEQSSNGIVIVKLAKNQRLKANLIAVKGIGKLHAKWVPSATCVYRYEPVIAFNPQVQIPLEVKRNIVERCPRRVFALQSQRDYGTDYATNYGAPADMEDIEVVNRMACIFCNECVAACNEAGLPRALSVTHFPSQFHFTCESSGSMPSSIIVTLGLEVLEKKIDGMLQALHRVVGSQSALVGVGAAEARMGGGFDLDLS